MLSLQYPLVFPSNYHDVTCVGELVADMIATEIADDFSQIHNFSVFPGGAPGNLASNIARFGFRASIVACVGKDGLGDMLCQHLQQNNVDISCIQRTDEANTSLAMITRSANSAKFLAYRQADMRLKLDIHEQNIIFDSKLVHVSTWPLSIPVLRKDMLSILQNARDKGIFCCLEPNFRPVLWKQDRDARQEMIKSLSAFDCVKPSLEDARFIFGQGLADHEYIERFCDCGCQLVILTKGCEGLIASNGKEIIEVPAYPVKVKDATGAGDAFLAGFYAGLLQKKSIQTSLYLGAAVAARKLRFIGATSGDLGSIWEIMNQFATPRGDN